MQTDSSVGAFLATVVCADLMGTHLLPPWTWLTEVLLAVERFQGKVVQTIDTSVNGLTGIDHVHDDIVIFTSYTENNATLYDCATGRIIQSFDLATNAKQPWGIQVLPTSDYSSTISVVFNNSSTMWYAKLNVATGEITKSVRAEVVHRVPSYSIARYGGPRSSLIAGAAGKRIVTGNFDPDASDFGKVTQRMDMKHETFAVSASIQQRDETVAVSCHKAFVLLVDLAARAVLGEFSLDNQKLPRGVLLLNDNRSVIVSEYDRRKVSLVSFSKKEEEVSLAVYQEVLDGFELQPICRMRPGRYASVEYPGKLVLFE